MPLTLTPARSYIFLGPSPDMHTIKYQELSRLSSEIGDEFYRCLSSWLKNPLDPRSRVSCLKQGHEYEKALVRQIEYLKKLTPSARSSAALQTCETYYKTLESQLQLLESAFKRDN